MQQVHNSLIALSICSPYSINLNNYLLLVQKFIYASSAMRVHLWRITDSPHIWSVVYFIADLLLRVSWWGVPDLLVLYSFLSPSCSCLNSSRRSVSWSDRSILCTLPCWHWCFPMRAARRCHIVPVLSQSRFVFGHCLHTFKGFLHSESNFLETPPSPSRSYRSIYPDILLHHISPLSQRIFSIAPLFAISEIAAWIQVELSEMRSRLESFVNYKVWDQLI